MTADVLATNILPENLQVGTYGPRLGTVVDGVFPPSVDFSILSPDTLEGIRSGDGISPLALSRAESLCQDTAAALCTTGFTIPGSTATGSELPNLAAREQGLAMLNTALGTYWREWQADPNSESTARAWSATLQADGDLRAAMVNPVADAPPRAPGTDVSTLLFEAESGPLRTLTSEIIASGEQSLAGTPLDDATIGSALFGPNRLWVGNAPVDPSIARGDNDSGLEQSAIDPGDLTRLSMDLRSSRATVIAPPPETTPPETHDPWKLPLMVSLATPEGQRLHSDLLNATAAITSIDDSHRFIGQAGDDLRNIALNSRPLAEEQIGALYPQRSLEGLTGVPRLYAEIDNDSDVIRADRLREDQRYGFRAPEMEVFLVERQNEDGTATASVLNRELQVGGTGAILSDRPGLADLDCVARICSVRTHPLSTIGSNAGLSTGDLAALGQQAEVFRNGGSDVEYSVASANVMDNTVTMATTLPGGSAVEVRVLSPNDLPIPDQIALGPYTIDTDEFDPDIPTYPLGYTEWFFDQMRRSEDAWQARIQADESRNRSLQADFDSRLAGGAPLPGPDRTGETDGRGGSGLQAPSDGNPTGRMAPTSGASDPDRPLDGSPQDQVPTNESSGVGGR